MIFKIKKNVLLEKLNIVSHALSQKNLIPILEGIKIEVKKDQITLFATDNDIYIKTNIPKKEINKIDEEGEVVIIGKYLIEIVRKLNNELITFEYLGDNKLLLSTTTSKINLNTFNSNEFPVIKETESSKIINLSKEEFKEIVGKTIFASSFEETRPILTGIHFLNNKKEIECTATDSYRLAKIFLNKKIKEEFDVVVPSKNLLTFIKILDNEGDINLNIFNNRILFTYNDVCFQTRILNGSYPNTSSLIPTKFELEIEIELKKFYEALDRVSLLTTEKEKNIVKLELNKNIINLIATIPEIGKVEEKIKLEHEYPKFEISFSAKYMLEAVKNLSSKTIKISFNGNDKPIIINEKDNNALINLILPIKTY